MRPLRHYKLYTEPVVILLYCLMTFAGFAVGRIGHIWGGHLNAPDHWIYGVILIFAGGILHYHWFGGYIAAFGIGHTVSDLKDMLELKFYGPDKVEVKKFWGID